MFASLKAERLVVEVQICCVMKAREDVIAPLSVWESFSCLLSDLLHHLLLLDLWPQLLQS